MPSERNAESNRRGIVNYTAAALKQGDFTSVPNSLINDPSVPAQLRLTWIIIAQHQWGAREASWPGVERIAQLLGVHELTARRYIHALRDMGYLKITERPGKTNIYELFYRAEPPTPNRSVRGNNHVTPNADVTPHSTDTPPLSAVLPEEYEVKNTKLNNIARAAGDAPGPSPLDNPTARAKISTSHRGNGTRSGVASHRSVETQEVSASHSFCVTHGKTAPTAPGELEAPGAEKCRRRDQPVENLPPAKTLAAIKLRAREISQAPPPKSEKKAKTVWPKEWYTVCKDALDILRGGKHTASGYGEIEKRAKEAFVAGYTPLQFIECAEALYKARDAGADWLGRISPTLIVKYLPDSVRGRLPQILRAKKPTRPPLSEQYEAAKERLKELEACWRRAKAELDILKKQEFLTDNELKRQDELERLLEKYEEEGRRLRQKMRAFPNS